MPDDFRLFVGRLYNSRKKSKSEAGSIGGSSKDQNDTCLTTAETIADEHGTSRATFVGRLYNSRKKSVGSVNQHTANRQSDGKQTAEAIAEEHGTSSRTVERAGKQAEAIDTPEQ